MTTPDCLRYLAACFLVMRDRTNYVRLRSYAITFELGTTDDREVIVDTIRTIVDRCGDRVRDGSATPAMRRHAGVWARALRVAVEA